ncbi:meso-butanediol dehydrogenase/(S,S)-butanediol dehydrogenase/diacetyl reductase [Arthrobacter sp. GAS37]|uniref:SDR family NAD(P)-dependent oxidoreductase n=1 Tax=Arthrobacter sp. GAS37 TaxID=3156261 RepID=UPI003834049F
MEDIDQRVAIVTGAGQGIGRGIAQVLARHGAAVVVTDIDEARAVESAALITAEGGRATGIAHDAADPNATNPIIHNAIEAYGRFDIMVNNAGIAAQMPFDEITVSDWDRLNSINQRGTFFAAQAAAKHFKEQQSGKIVNISSFSGRKAVEEYLIYNATKAAVIMMTQTLALELGPFNVNVNAICPGIVKTPIWDTLDPEQWTRQEKQIPLRRGQTPEDIGEAVAFLASERSKNITGAVLAVTGGLAMF